MIFPLPFDIDRRPIYFRVYAWLCEYIYDYGYINLSILLDRTKLLGMVSLPLNTSISHHLAMSEYDEGTFRCTICAKEFLSKDEADKHFVDAHSGEKTNVME